jgi:hypothetical protein
MFVALVIGAVLVPSTVYAVDAFSNVVVQDPVTGNEAKVKNGALRIGDGSGALTVDDGNSALTVDDGEGSLTVDDGSGPLTVDGAVSLTGSDNNVNVTSSPGNPVNTRDTPQWYGDTMTMSASNGGVACQPIDLAAPRKVRIESASVAISGGGSPSAWLEIWGELTPGGGAGVAGELGFPLVTQAAQFFSHSSSRAMNLVVGGGTEFDNDGLIARVSVCLRAQNPGSSTLRAFVTGVYLDA